MASKGTQTEKDIDPKTVTLVTAFENLSAMLPDVKKELDSLSQTHIIKLKSQVKDLTEAKAKANRDIEQLKKKKETETGTLKKQNKEHQEAIKKLKTEIERLNEQVKIDKQIQECVANEIDGLQKEKKRIADENEHLTKQNATLEQDLLECKTRLSRLMGVKLNDNNPAIADLSDKTRPTKLKEKYSELYDNEWTDAFEYLQQNIRDDDQKCIKFLLKLLEDIMKFCVEQSRTQHQQILHAVSMSETSDKETKDLSDETKKHAKDFRKEVANESLPNIIKGYKRKLKESQNEKYRNVLNTGVEPFVDACIELCWSMVIQDPPVVLGKTKEEHGTAFSSETYKEYTVTGPFFDFIVWPALYLHDGGPLLEKGVAQAFKTPNTSNTQTAGGNTAAKETSRKGKKEEQQGKPVAEGNNVPVHVGKSSYRPSEAELSKFIELAKQNACIPKFRHELGEVAFRACCKVCGYEIEEEK